MARNNSELGKWVKNDYVSGAKSLCKCVLTVLTPSVFY